MPSTQRQMTMVAFLQAQNCSNLPGSWRHPASMSDFLTPDYYQRIARILEDGKFHMAFFDDRLAMPDIYANDFRNTVAHGVRAVKLDPLTIVMMMAAAGFTASEPESTVTVTRTAVTTRTRSSLAPSLQVTTSM